MDMLLKVESIHKDLLQRLEIIIIQQRLLGLMEQQQGQQAL